MKKVLLLSVCGLLLFTGCGNNKEVTDASEIKVKVNEEENVDVVYEITNNDVIITLKNNNSEIIDYLNVDVALFDKDNNLIRVEKQYVRNLMADKENVVKVSLTQIEANEENKTIPSRVEVALNKTVYASKFETVYSDKITANVENTETEGQLNMIVTNTSGVVIDDLSAVAVFYKDSKIVDIYVANAQNVGDTTTQTVYIPTTMKDGKVTYIEYDDVKVVINNASKYNTNA